MPALNINKGWWTHYLKYLGESCSTGRVRGTWPQLQALAGAENAGKHVQGFLVVPDDQEEKLQLLGGDISEKVPRGA